MTKPINTKIFDEIEARLGNITAVNGYYNGLKKIARATQKPFKGYDLPTANFWAGTLANDSDTYGDDTRTLPVVIEEHAKTMDRAFIDVCDELAADLVTGINRATTAPRVDDNESNNLGGMDGLIEDVKFLGYEYQIGQGQEPWCGIMATFEIIYRIDINIMSS